MKNWVLNLIRNDDTPQWARWTFLLVFVVTVIFGIGAIRTRVEIKEQNKKLEQITEECVLQKNENEALNELLLNGSEYIERRAREDMDMVLPGERVYIVRAGN